MSEHIEPSGGTEYIEQASAPSNVEETAVDGGPGQVRHGLGERLGEGVLTAAHAVDDLPVSVSNLGRAALRWAARRRRAAASRHEQWAQVEARRQRDDGAVTMLSDDLTMQDWVNQERWEAEAYPDPWWVPVARLASRAQVATAAGAVVYGLQRARRGWADYDAWNVGSTGSRVLGEQLLHLSRTATGYPASGPYNDYATWTAALASAGRALVSYGRADRSDELTMQWHAAVQAGASQDDAEALRRRIDAAELEDLTAAKEALHWVAEHLECLWD